YAPIRLPAAPCEPDRRRERHSLAVHRCLAGRNELRGRGHLGVRRRMPAAGRRAAVAELLDPQVGDVDAARAVNGDPVRDLELAVAQPLDAGVARAPTHLVHAGARGHAPARRAEEATGARELLDPLVALVADVDVARAVDGDPDRGVELAGARALDACVAR